MDHKKITVKELAQKLGVSISTVSKALNDSYEISDSTKQRVKKLAKEYNYKPNRLAVNLKSGKTRTIGVILPSIKNFFFTDVLYGIEQVTNKNDFNIITCFSNESHEKEVTNTEILSNGSIDGLIVALAEETQINRQYSHFKDCINEGTPMVMFDRVAKSISCDKVVVDDFNDAYLATKHLVDFGCKKLALVSAIEFLAVGKARVKGFKKAAEDLLGDQQPQILLNTSVKKLKLEIQDMLDQQKIDGVLAVDEDSSLAIYSVAKNKGYIIPNDIAIIGYTGKKLAKNISPSLTTINQNGVKIGKAAAKILINRMGGKGLDFVTKIIHTNIVQRESTSKKV